MFAVWSRSALARLALSIATVLCVVAPNAAPTLAISNDVVIGNTSGVTVGANGTVYTYGNNRIDGNTTDVNGALTNLAQR